MNPGSFIWSKIGDAYSGEPIEGILARKEIERARNGGLFMWGSGVPLGPSLRSLLEIDKAPRVVITRTLHRRKPDEVQPDQSGSVWVWPNASVDGRPYRLPLHSIVTGQTKSGRMWAMILSKDTQLMVPGEPAELLYRSELRTWPRDKELTDHSPTAVVRGEPRPADAPPPADTPYQVLFTATLVPPYFVEMADPVEIQMRKLPARVQADLADRLAKSLQLSGLSVQQIAELLEVNRNTISSWLNRRAVPSPPALMVWAQHTSVPYEWLRTGSWPSELA
jgi:Putative ATPase subunit of terminase (gpP-like)